MEPLVSVIVPARDEAGRIGEALDSLGDDDRLEILVIDDRSTDGTRAVVEARADPRIRVLTTDGTEPGLGPARNVGLDAATGTWVAFLDADDAWTPGRIGALLSDADGAGADFVVDDIHFDDGPTLFGDRALRVEGVMPLSPEHFVALDLGVVKPLVRRDLIGDLRFRAETTEDFPFWLRCLLVARHPVLSPHGGYRYRQTTGRSRLSHPTAAYWTGAAETTARLLATMPDLPATVRSGLRRRYRRQLRRSRWMTIRADVAAGRRRQALARLLSHPAAILVAGEQRRVRLLRRIWR